MLNQLLAMFPGDQGPIYAETHAGRIPVEPWNVYSNLIFLAVLVYGLWRTRLAIRVAPVTVVSLPLLAAGFVGGTLYHALRNNDAWRILDAAPIAMLALLASVYFWSVVLGGAARAMLIVAIPAVLYRVGVDYADSNFSQHALIMIGYGFLATLVIVPAILHCRRANWRGGWQLLAGALCFGVGFFFRQIDAIAPRYHLPMGTHFLWHLFGGAAAFFVLNYLFDSEREAAGAIAVGAFKDAVSFAGLKTMKSNKR